jgi:eukaryotic-like serine/threonine-protein kinase
MAIVFLAEDLKHHRRVAIKVLEPELSTVIGDDRFLREIQIAATLQHPHILPLYDSGRAGSLVYYVMPFAEGESLRQLLDREPQLPIDDALRIAREVGGALQYAHERGVVHRDIKPENIMLSGGHAYVADFGIARALEVAGGENITRTGTMLGTPHYMSPEQVGGFVDGRSDQYSLACMLYEMLVGQPPFTGTTSQAILARHSLDTVPSLRVVRGTVPPSVETAIVHAMAKVPADRFASMREFLEAMESPLTESGATALPARPVLARSSPSRRVVVGVGIVVMATIVAWFAATRWGSFGTKGPMVATVAVLPFEKLPSGPDSSYLAEGMTEGLLAELAGIASLKVIAGSSGSLAQGRGGSLIQLAHDLGADAIVRGSIRKVEDSIQVSVRFLRARDSTSLFAGDYGARLGELPDLQRKITIAVSRSIHARLAEPERRRLDAHHEVDPRALESYLRGRFHFDQGDLEQARALFDQAIRFAPQWAPPYVGLANYYTSLPFSSDVPPAEVLPNARAALAQALQLDESLAEAHAANAYIRAYYEWDWRAAEQEFRRALELRPSYSDAYFSYGRFLASRRRLDEAIAQVARAVDLDPLSTPLKANRALLEYFAGRYEQAGAELREMLETDSTDVTAQWGLALVDEQQGRSKDAVATLERIAGAGLNRKSSLGHAYAVAGKTTQARAVLASLDSVAASRYVPSYYFALLHTALGQRDQALRDLERAYEERSTVLAYLRIDPRLAPLHEEPRFVALAKRLDGE